MTIQTSQQPGAHERQLQRCNQNPLFPEKRRKIIQIEINQAQRRDAEDARRFAARFRTLVQRAIDLKPEEDSEVILALKEDLDRAYEDCCGLAGDPAELKAALKKLIDVVMHAVWRGAGSDAAAQAELHDEEQARRTHFALLEHPLIADLLRPDSPIAQDELTSTLLSESAEAVAAAVGLFDADQLTLICHEARQLIATLPNDSPWCASASARLTQIEQHLNSLAPLPGG